MRMRVWATNRSHAFSISALIEPVRMRAVASGFIIEKVRSIAMISSLKSAVYELRRLYRRHRGTASDEAKCGGSPAEDRRRELQQFHEHEPSLKPTSRFRSASHA